MPHPFRPGPLAAVLLCLVLPTGSPLAAGGIVPNALYGPGEAPQNPAPAPTGGPLDQDELLGDMGGLRTGLAKYGASVHLGEISEILDNFSGGIGRGPLYEGLTDLNVGLDLRPYFGWRGVFFVRVYQIHGRGLTANEVDNLNTISGIEATRTTRLFEAWYEQHIGDWLRIRIGEQSAGQEFIVTSTARVFVNGAFGWPTLPSVDLPSGGPGFPLGTPAVRFRIDFNDELTFFSGIFDGNPTGAPLGTANPQARDLSGTAFRTSDGVLWINEVRYNPGNSPATGGYRLGAWYNSERFPDIDLASNGVSLANPASTGIPRRYNGDFSFYGIVDQPVFHKENSDDGFSLFARAMGAPGDRNLVDLYLDGGVAYKGLTGHGDTLALGVAFAHIGSAARALDAEQATLTNGLYPIRSSETAVELTYQFNIARWWTLQPDLQYIVNPGGGIPDPQAPTIRIKNALIGGVRTIITF